MLTQEYIESKGWKLETFPPNTYVHKAYNIVQDGFFISMTIIATGETVIQREERTTEEVLFDGILTENKHLDLIMSLLNYTF